MESVSKLIAISKIKTDGGTQLREKIDTDTVAEYAERLGAGDTFPPVDVFFDGKDYWLANGFHRFHAHVEAGKKKIEAVVRKGTVRDAILFSCGANAINGLKRTNADKRRAIEVLLKDPVWMKATDTWIAEMCVVSRDLVLDVRRSLVGTTSDDHEKRLGKDGVERAVSSAKRSDSQRDRRQTEARAKVKARRDKPTVEANEAEPTLTPPVEAKATPTPTAFDSPEEHVSSIELYPRQVAAPVEHSQVDDDGNPVPQELLDVFEAREDFIQLSQDLRELSGKLTELCRKDAGKYLKGLHVAGRLHALSDEVLQATPSIIHPDHGWLPRHGMPEEVAA